MVKFNGISKLMKNTSGNVAMMAALVILPVALAGGAALDYTHHNQRVTDLQGVVDAAALIGAKTTLNGTTKEAKAAARKYLKANLSAEQLKELKKINVTIDKKTKKVTVIAKAESPTSIMQLAGITKLKYEPSATVNLPGGKLEIILVLDSTGSMKNDNKMVDLKKSAKEFIDDMLKVNASYDATKIGIVPFARYVNIGTSLKDEKWIDVDPTTKSTVNEVLWKGCVGSRNYPLNLTDTKFSKKVPGVIGSECPTPITPLTSNKKTLQDEIDALNPSGSTYIPAGLSWGLRAISSKAPFKDGVSKAKAKKDNVQKVIVLMTDGENQSSAQVPASFLHEGKDLDKADEWTSEVCENIKGEGITLFTIGFGTSIPKKTLTMLQKCSTNGTYYTAASDGKALSSSFEQISQKLSQLYLSN